MLYIGFSTRTHKLYAKIFCRKYKHCAPVVIRNDTCCLYQFVNKNNIAKIQLNKRDLKILKHYGWIFIKYKTKLPHTTQIKAITCVQYTKKFCNITNRHILTPDDLLKYLK